MPPFTPKAWKNLPDRTTPISAEALIDLETRVTDHADQHSRILYDAKGDILVAVAADSPARLPVGSDGQVLTADSGETPGVKWAPPLQGPPGTSPFLNVRDLDPDPDSVTDWGPLIQGAIDANVRRLVFPSAVYPYSTPINLVNNREGVLFEGEMGRGWYSGESVDETGARWVWKGGASTVVNHTDGAITASDATLTSASAPWTETGVTYNGYPITVVGAGPGGTDLVTQIRSRNSSSSVELLDAASTTVTDASYTFSDYTRVIDGRGSNAVQFRDLKLLYDDPLFDGILVDLRSGSSWSSRGQFKDCMVGGRVINWGQAEGNQTVIAYALVHLCGHGEQFLAEGTSFHGAKAAIRGMYNNNCDDAAFRDCKFSNLYEGAIVNPGRFWNFDNCTWMGSGWGGPRTGPQFLSDGIGFSIGSEIYLRGCHDWDHGGDFETENAAMTQGSKLLDLSAVVGLGRLRDYDNQLFFKNRTVCVKGAGDSGIGDYLMSRVVRKVDDNTLELEDAALNTVADAGWYFGDGGLLLTRSTYNWKVSIQDQMGWTPPPIYLSMLGGGDLVIKNWNTGKSFRDDIPGAQYAIDLGSSVTDRKKVWLENIGVSSPNLDNDELYGILNWEGHDIRRITDFQYAPGHRQVAQMEHESVNVDTTAFPTKTPLQTLSSSDIWGHDLLGTIRIVSPAGGLTAGGVLQISFIFPWYGAATSGKSDVWKGNLHVLLSPLQPDGQTCGPDTVAAGAYAIVNKDTPNLSWKLAIANAVTGTKTLFWAYRVFAL